MNILERLANEAKKKKDEFERTVKNNAVTRGVSRSIDQVNPLDGGRTWKQRTPVKTGSAVRQATHSGASNAVGSVVKPLVQTSIALNQGIGNAQVKTAQLFGLRKDLKTQNAQEFIDQSIGRNANRAIDYKGTKRQITGAAISTVANVAMPGSSKVVSGAISKVIPKTTPAILQKFAPKVAGGSAAGATSGAVGQTGEYIASNEKLTARGFRDNAATGAKYGAILGGAAPVALPVAKVAAKATGKVAKAAGKEVKTSYDKKGVVADYDATINRLGRQKKELQSRIQNTDNFRGVETTQRHIDDIDNQIAQVQSNRPQLTVKDKILAPNIGLSARAVRPVDAPQSQLPSKQADIPPTPETPAVDPQNVPQQPTAQRIEMSIPDDAPSAGNRERGLATTIANDPNTPDAVKAGVAEMYKIRNTKDLQSRAANLVRDDIELAQRVFNSDSNTDVGTMIGGELAKVLSRSGQTEASIAVAVRMAREATERGQANQALSTWGKLAPESILRFTQTVVNDYNKSAGLIGGRELQITPQQARKISRMSEKLQDMPDGRDKDIATKKMLREVQAVVPVSWVKKLATVQTIAQLLNPKTLIRNVIGNTLFNPLEMVSQTIGTGIDKGIAAGRGSAREVTLPQIGTQLRGTVTGAKQQIQELQQGVNLGPETQYDLNDVPVFKNKAMQKIETALGYSLRVSDRAAYTAAYDDALQGLMKANNLEQPSQRILELAHAQGLYRTFQDNSKGAQLFMKLKAAFNTVGITGKDGSTFGLGDMILKYPKTPGNLIARGVDYSPVGIIAGILKAGVHSIQGKPFDQAAFSMAIGRGVTGTTGLIGTGAALGALGIITEKPSDDADTRNLQKASGQGGYQINTSALRRFIASGFDKKEAELRADDTLVSYDWAQPASIPLSTGAAIGRKQSPKDAAVSTVTGISEGLNSLIEQPLVTGVNTFASNIKNKGIVGAFGETAKGLPASFVPTISNQAKQLGDNTARNTYSDNLGQEVVNKVKNRIPGLSTHLYPQVTPFGTDKEVYQNDSNNLFNVAFNPSFVSKYQPSDNAKLPLNIQNKTGETKQMPLTPKTKQKINDEVVKMTAGQNNEFARYVGTETDRVFNQLRGDQKFMALPEAEQAKKISNILSDINANAKATILGDQQDKKSANQKSLAKGGDARYSTTADGETATYTDKYEQALEEQKSDSKDWSPATKIKKQNELDKLSVQKDFDTDTIDLYSLSKSDLYKLASEDKNGKTLVDKVIAYGDKLAEITGDKNKFRNSKGVVTIRPRESGTGSTGRRRGALKPSDFKTPYSELSKTTRRGASLARSAGLSKKA